MHSLQSTLTLTTITEVIMSKELLISMLQKGKNGEQILTILDMIAGSDDDESLHSEPTLEEIQF